MILEDKNLNVATIEGLNEFIDTNTRREAEECAEYFKSFEIDPFRSRRQEEAFIGWPLLRKWQVRYVKNRVNVVTVEKKDGIYLIKLDRPKVLKLREKMKNKKEDK